VRTRGKRNVETAPSGACVESRMTIWKEEFLTLLPGRGKRRGGVTQVSIGVHTVVIIVGGKGEKEVLYLSFNEEKETAKRGQQPICLRGEKGKETWLFFPLEEKGNSVGHFATYPTVGKRGGRGALKIPSRM